jgi:hypothetical protein
MLEAELLEVSVAAAVAERTTSHLQWLDFFPLHPQPQHRPLHRHHHLRRNLKL